MSVDIYSDVFVNNLPESINWDSQVQAIGYASDQNCVRLQNILPQLYVLCNIPNLPEPTLDLLAFQFQVLFYNAANTITDPVLRLAVKQQLIANNFYYHAHLGTLATVQQIVTSIFMPAFIQEWFLYGGTANHFRILLEQVITSTMQGQILSLVNVVKRVSQTFDGFFLYSKAPTQFYVAVGVYTQIWLFLPMPVIPAKITYATMGLAIYALGTVARSSAIVNNVMGISISATPRQVIHGMPVVDIEMGISVRAALGALQRAIVMISMAERVST